MAEQALVNRNVGGFGVGQKLGRRGSPLTQLIRAGTKNGAELMEFALSVLRGEATQPYITAQGKQIEVGPTMANKLEALKWLGDHGFPKPKPEPDAEAVSMSREERLSLLAEDLRAHGLRIVRDSEVKELPEVVDVQP